jgi:hypothetical protein
MYNPPMNDIHAQQYLQRLESKLAAGIMAPAEALHRAYVLGGETERMDAMHHACAEYSRARAAREAAFRGDSTPPPPRK